MMKADKNSRRLNKSLADFQFSSDQWPKDHKIKNQRSFSDEWMSEEDSKSVISGLSVVFKINSKKDTRSFLKENCSFYDTCAVH